MLYEVITVFIIDDEDRIRQLVADYLDDFDEFEIRVAATGEDALEELAREPADVCIVDMRLPGISGEEFILTAGTRGLSKRFLLHTGSMDFNLSKGNWKSPELISGGWTGSNGLRLRL